MIANTDHRSTAAPAERTRAMASATPDKPAAKPLPDPAKATTESFDVRGGDGHSEKLVDAIEMIGEETAGGLRPAPSEVTAGMRYLHCSRTIHQLVTDR